MRTLTFEQQIQERVRASHPLLDAFTILDAADARRNGNADHDGALAPVREVGVPGPLSLEQQIQANKIRDAIGYVLPLLTNDGARTVEYTSSRRGYPPAEHNAWEIDNWTFLHPKIIHRRQWHEPTARGHTRRLARLMLVDDDTLQVFSDPDVRRIPIATTHGGWQLKVEAGKPLNDLSLLALTGRWAENPDQAHVNGSLSALWESRLLELPLK